MQESSTGLVSAWRSCTAPWGSLPFPGYRIVFGMGVCRAGSRVLNEVFWFPLVRLEGNEKETQAGLCAAPRAAAASVRNTSGIWWESPPVKLQVSHTNWRLVKV